MIVHHAALKSGTIAMEDNTTCGRLVASHERPTPGHHYTSGWRGVNCKHCLDIDQGVERVVVDHDDAVNVGPVFPHDCESCIHLDTVEGERTHDIYFHPGGIGNGRPTIVCRRGPEGPDYFSGLAFATKEPLIALGLVLALKRGLIQYEDALKRL